MQGTRLGRLPLEQPRRMPLVRRVAEARAAHRVGHDVLAQTVRRRHDCRARLARRRQQAAIHAA